MQALIDADIVAYRCSAVTEGEHESTALFQVNELMNRIVQQSGADTYRAFLTGEGNFRRTINPKYKANRKDKPKPKHLKVCQDFIAKEWNGEWCLGYEADDAMGMYQTENSIICSIDKDLLMIPGKHFNFVNGDYVEITNADGAKHFWKQMLIGDSTDNIFGIDKIGKVKAAKIIDPMEYEWDMMETVYEMYGDPNRFKMNADCLWIWRKEGELWTKRNSGPLAELEASLQAQSGEDSDDGLLSFSA